MVDAHNFLARRVLRSAIAVVGSLVIGSAALAETARCPAWEAGARYPWQSNDILRGDHFAWVVLDVDRHGLPSRCRVGANNYEDAEDRFWLCEQYSRYWRGPPAGEADPAMRKFERYSLIASYAHDKADKRARAVWFRAHPDARPECYPEPTRPDRMDLGLR